MSWKGVSITGGTADRCYFRKVITVYYECHWHCKCFHWLKEFVWSDQTNSLLGATKQTVYLATPNKLKESPCDYDIIMGNHFNLLLISHYVLHN